MAAGHDHPRRMHLHFLRHAQAEPREHGQDHPDRRLTPFGIRQATRMGAHARRQGLAFDAILASPLRRARETAELFAGELPQAPAVEQVAWLAIDTPTPVARARIAERIGPGGHLLLVGHEPDFSALIGALLGLDPEGIRIRKASLTCLACTDAARGRFQLQWSVTPGMLAR